MLPMFTVGCLTNKEVIMSKISELIKKLKLKPFPGEMKKADARENPPIPVPKPIKPKEEDK